MSMKSSYNSMPIFRKTKTNCLISSIKQSKLFSRS